MALLRWTYPRRAAGKLPRGRLYPWDLKLRRCRRRRRMRFISRSMRRLCSAPRIVPPFRRRRCRLQREHSRPWRGCSRNAGIVTTLSKHGTGLQARSVDGGSSSYVPGPFWTEPLWLKLRKQGTTLTGYSSLDGSNWTTIGSFDLPQSNPTGFPPLFLIGLAVTSHNTSALNTSMFDNVTFTPLP